MKSVSPETVENVRLCIHRGFFEATGLDAQIHYYYDNEIEAFMARSDAEELLSSGVLTPDELVYANGPAMWVVPRKDLEITDESVDADNIAKRLKQQIRNGDKHSLAFLVKDVGLFVAGSRKIAQTVRDIVLYSAFIRINTAQMGGIFTLNKHEQDFINEWESEAFRKKIADGSAK